MVKMCIRDSVSTAVLATGFRVGWPVHVGQERDFLYPQRIDNDMHMDIAAVVMSVRVGAYKGLVAGEMLGAKLLAQCLRPVYGQAVVRPVPVSYTHLMCIRDRDKGKADKGNAAARHQLFHALRLY